MTRINYTEHGFSRHPLYNRYIHMMDRCYNTQAHNYKNYGAKGIIVESFLKLLSNYIEYVGSLPNAYNKELTIDRIDNEIGYVRGNLRWADSSTQNSNRSNNNKYIGVGFAKRNNIYRARLTHKKIVYMIGYFKTEKEAVIARNRFIKEKGFPHKIQSL